MRLRSTRTGLRTGHQRHAAVRLHKSAGRDSKIADALSKLVEDSRQEPVEDKDEGTEGHDEPEGHAGGTDER